MNYSARSTVEFSLPLDEGITILHPEKAILWFYASHAIDMGALCYLRRSSEKRLSNGAGRRVELASFDQQRARKIQSFISFLSEEIAHSGKRRTTLHAGAASFIRFMDWSDRNQHINVLDCEAAARATFRSFVAHLRERVNQNSFSVNTAARLQNEVLDLLSGFMGVDNLYQGINLLRKRESATETTMPPCENAQAKVLSLCSALFNGLTELVLEEKPYPFHMLMPKYLEWPEDRIWIFPTSRWCTPPYLLAERHTLKHPHWAYNYADGRLATVSEIAEHCSSSNDLYIKAGKKSSATRLLKNAKNIIVSANADPHHIHRRYAAMLALNSFVLLFVAHTGMNMQCVRDLSWSDEFDVEVDGQGFRTIKYRANNREVNFRIEVIFLPIFKRFLKLRKYLLDGASYNRLFFSLGANVSKAPAEIGTYLIHALFISLRMFDPHLPKVMPKQWRVSKSNFFLMRKEDPATAALIMQNSENTLLKSYAAGSPTRAMEEMTSYFDQVARVVVNKEQPIAQGVDGPVGACASFGAPHQVADHVLVTPDCKKPEGCFFCDKHRVHADERDTRKLLSCRFCIHQTSHLSATEEHFQRLFGPVLARIQQILDEVCRMAENKEMVERVTREVEEEGELDPYWESKMELLINLELVA